MQISPIQKTMFGIAICTATLTQAFAGDATAGKVKAEQQCGQCHRPSDFNGETTTALESLIKEISAGKIPHPKKVIRLSNEDLADIAAYWTRSQKKR